MAKSGETAFDEFLVLADEFFKLTEQGKLTAAKEKELGVAMTETYSRMTEKEKLEYGLLCDETGRCRPKD